MNIINKVAFLVHEPTMYTHYSSVWSEMAQTDFTIVLYSRFNNKIQDISPGAKDFINKIVKLEYEFYYFNDLLRDKIKFKYVVSNHVIGGISARPAPLKTKLANNAKNLLKDIINVFYRISNDADKYHICFSDPVQYLPTQIGVHQIRFMYGADISDGWSLQSWNEIYDLFLCHGPNDEAQIRKRFKGKTVVMGYPRYDRFFLPNLDVGNIAREFGIDPSKKTILWMTTIGEGACSIPYFAKAISGLFSEYNIIVRPHPLSFRKEPYNIDLLKSLSFTIDEDATRDMNELFKVADWVLCDYGGSSFGAIYLGKNLILLDVPGSDSEFTVVDSSNLELRDYFPVVSPEDACKLKLVIEDDAQIKTQEVNRRSLFARYFADYRGSSSRRAAEILSNLDSLLEA